MNQNKIPPVSVFFRFEFLYYFLVFLAYTTIIVDIVIFYAKGEQSDYDYYPSVSETNVYFPQTRIFSVGLSLTAIILLFYGVLRHHMISIFLLKSKKVKKNSKLILGLRIFMNILLVSASVNMILFSSLPCRYYSNAHDFTAGTFFASIFFYFLMDDIICWRIGRKPKTWSFSVTILIAIFAILFIVVRRIGSKSSKSIRYTIADISETIAILVIPIKLVVLVKTSPKHALKITRKEKTQKDHI